MSTPEPTRRERLTLWWDRHGSLVRALMIQLLFLLIFLAILLD